MTVFKELLSIKVFRENKAELAVRRQRHLLAQAQRERDEAQQALERFMAYAVGHERALYADLCSRIVKLRDIEGVQQQVVDLRGREREHEAQLAAAQQQRDAQATKLEQDKAAHAEATRMKEKFVELASNYAQERLRELERKEDAELEEAAETRRDRADWDEREGVSA